MDRAAALVLIFDLPTTTSAEQRRYREFRKNIKRMGFMCVQESVYIKHIKNISTTRNEIAKVDLFAPKEGSLWLIPLNLSALKRTVFLRGEKFDFNIFSDDIICV